MKKFKKSILATLILIFTVSLIPFRVLAEDNTSITPPDLYAKSALSIDLETNEIIYSKNMDSKAYPASITKLLTALLLAENKQKGDLLKYTQNAKSQPPFSYGLNVHPVNVGDEITAEDAMDALLLYSGNDIAYMIADNVGGSPEEFAKLMNKKAKELNMNSSNFVTPNGLDDNTDEHYSTAADIAKLVKAAYSNPWVKESMSKKESEISFLNGNSALLKNRNKLIGTDGCIGGKTGYTAKAGKCLAAAYEKDNRKLVGVVMNSKGSTDEDLEYFEDMTKLMNYSYSAQEKDVLNKDSVIKTEEVSYKVIPFIGPTKVMEVPVSLKEDVKLFNTDIEYNQEFNLENLNPWSIKESSPIGKLKVTQGDYVKEYDLYSSLSKMVIIKDNIIVFIALILGVALVAFILFIIILKIKNRSRRNRKYRY